MDCEMAQRFLEDLQKRRAKKFRAWKYFELIRRRDELQDAFNLVIRETGLKDLFVDHELTRKEDGKWVWINTKKKRKSAPDSTVNEGLDS